VNAVAGKPNKATFDKGDRYRKQCAELAECLGWGASEVYDVWKHLAMMREFECRWPRSCAEWQAMRDVRAALYKPGAEGD